MRVVCGLVALAVSLAGLPVHAAGPGPASGGASRPEAVISTDPNWPPDEDAHWSTTLFQVDDEKCNWRGWPHPLLSHGLLWANKSGPTKIAAEKRLFIQAWSDKSEGSGSFVRYVHCKSIASFIPTPGAKYQASHEAHGNSCKLVITDLATGAAPETFVAYRPEGLCL